MKPYSDVSLDISVLGCLGRLCWALCCACSREGGSTQPPVLRNPPPPPAPVLRTPPPAVLRTPSGSRQGSPGSLTSGPIPGSPGPVGSGELLPWPPWCCIGVLAAITACAPRRAFCLCGPCPSGPFRPTDMWSLQVVMLVACPSRHQGPPGGCAWGGGAAGTNISLQSPVPTEPLAASVARHPPPGVAPAPGGKQAGARRVLCPSGAPRAARRLSSRRVYRFLFRGSRVVTSPVCSLSGLFLRCVSLLCPGPGVYLERGESDCSLSRAHLDLIQSISLEAYFLRWSPDGADTALRAPVC